MKHFTIFASRNDIHDIENIISEVFGKGYEIKRDENDYALKSKTLFGKHKMTIRVASEDTNPDYFDQNIPGMMGFYERIPFEDEKLKALVMTQISVLNTMLAIEMEKDITDEQMPLFTALLSRIVGGIGFLPNGILLDQAGDVIVYPDGKSGSSDFRPLGCTRKILGPEITSKEGEQRKNKNIAYLNEMGIPFISWLPQLPPLEQCKFKAKEDIARRAVTVLIVIQFACDVAQGEDIQGSREFFTDMLQKFGVEEYLTENERKLLQDEEPVMDEAINISWQYEAYWTLIWALGLVETLDFPDQTCDCDYAIEVVSSCETFEQFLLKTAMRSKEEVLDEADKIYRLHWACVNNRINEGKEAPAGMDESIVIERRRGLFWMIGYRDEEWDHISMDT
ncbi:DUF4272 domain-containing protein [Paenibacillus sp. MZ04-78.2]|uniref:DUF4272 domain-containing protein n=1 Tax=Paenibacillus sp. MZ04-78.2 TaxID=2962034 RepID=UPI0020B7929E|nr:DUF4272 domain-containing protein [Paenibacillus sp. MZ04-78.2]MCP3774024.1 DUF4272 domain-containing protein [Paenibacillus sp. MZ04-78.2]